MQRLIFIIVFISFISHAIAQKSTQQPAALLQFLSDPQLKAASVGLKIVQSSTGKVMVDYQADIGLAPASTLKVLTSITALDVLGSKFTYTTNLGWKGELKNGILHGNIVIQGSGDPSLGSWRFPNQSDTVVIKNWVQEILKSGIREVKGSIEVNTAGWNSHAVPGGWIWDDIGNYYGAGAWGLNWRENQYDVHLLSGNEIGSDVEIIKIQPVLYGVTWKSELKAAAKGTGDNAYIYLPPFATVGIIRGTIPVGENKFVIAGSMPDPSFQLVTILKQELQKKGIIVGSASITTNTQTKIISQSVSPPLDSLISPFMQKSINLYGEAFLKTISLQKSGKSASQDAVQWVRNYWKEQIQLDPAYLRIIDGSGLSPQNRVTAGALTDLLEYARRRDWFQSFEKSFSVQSGMKLKSGTIGGVKAYAGYYEHPLWGDVSVAFIVNNYQGSASALVQKMFSLLQQIKQP